MTMGSGAKIVEAAKDAVAIAKGEQPAARVHMNGFAYEPVDRWQPISTAPKDSKVILWLADEGFPVMATWRVLDKGTEDEWEGFWFWELDLGDDFHNATHWQPLPAPPFKE